MEEIFKLITETEESIIDIRNFPDNDEHADFAQAQLIELKNKIRKILLV